MDFAAENDAKYDVVISYALLHSSDSGASWREIDKTRFPSGADKADTADPSPGLQRVRFLGNEAWVVGDKIVLIAERL